MATVEKLQEHLKKTQSDLEEAAKKIVMLLKSGN